MAPVKNGRIVFNERPKGPMLKDQAVDLLLTKSLFPFRSDSEYPEPGKTTIYDEPEIDLDTVSLDGGILIKTLVLSADPYMRGAMKARTPLFCFLFHQSY
jgi:NADPH-dependent curcumin reductase CurA